MIAAPPPAAAMTTMANAVIPAELPAGRKHPPSAEDLILAVESGDADAVRACLSGGVHVESRDDDGRTAVMLAALRGHEACYEALRAAGASLTARDRQGVQALVYVRNFGALPRDRVLALRSRMLRSLLQARLDFMTASQSSE